MIGNKTNLIECWRRCLFYSISVLASITHSRFPIQFREMESNWSIWKGIRREKPLFDVRLSLYNVKNGSLEWHNSTGTWVIAIRRNTHINGGRANHIINQIWARISKHKHIVSADTKIKQKLIRCAQKIPSENFAIKLHQDIFFVYHVAVRLRKMLKLPFLRNDTIVSVIEHGG